MPKIVLVSILNLLILLLYHVSIGSSEPWAVPKSDHPVTLDVQFAEKKRQMFSPRHLFTQRKVAPRESYPLNRIFDFYERHVTTLNGSTCRYYPTCSSYTKESIQRFGLVLGLVVGAERFMRCHEYQDDEIFDPVRLW